MSIRIAPGSIVSARIGPLVLSHPGAKRRTKSVIFGKVTKAMGPHEYEVTFTNGEIHPVASSKLTVVSEENIPPSLRSNANDVEEDISSDEDEYVFVEEEDIGEEEEEDTINEDEDDDEEDENLLEMEGSKVPLIEEDTVQQPNGETHAEKLVRYREKVQI